MKPYRVIKLMKNHIYPTFQLYAQMRQTKTDPHAGLKLAALTTLEWLRRRLDDDVPEELKAIPAPDQYLSCSDDQLPSVHINAGYLIDIVSMPAQGVWTLQIGEPDLGSDPGDPDQKRDPVPGRVIETNIAYKIIGGRLECGFQTLISDPDGTEGEAEVYRLAVVRQLAAHPDFGLRQLEPLTEDYEVLDTEDGLKRALSLARNKENQLPLVFFTQMQEEKQAAPTRLEMSTDILFQADFKLDLTSVPMPPQKQTVSDPPYDMAGFAKYGIGLCRSYLVSANLLDKLIKQTKQKVKPGEIMVLEPVRFGGSASVLPYSPNKGRQQETMDKLRELMYQYPRNREADFGQLAFLSAAREKLLKQTQFVEKAAGASAERWEEEKRQLGLEYQTKLLEREHKAEGLQEQLRRQQEYQERIEGEKRELRQQMADLKKNCQLQLEEKDEEIGYLKRKLSQPKTHEEIAPWVELNFRDRLILHSKAVALLEDKASHSVDVGLICDALDFLATDYWERRYQQITTDEMNSRCGEKYGRPFDVTPTGTTTIEFTPAQYKIKYFPGRAGKPVESPLDFHLGVGNDPENLLRIYFLHDDAKKLIVVGSLPRHLRAVTIK